MNQPGTGEFQPHSPRLVDRIKGALKTAGKTITELGNTPVPVNEINPGNVARVIWVHGNNTTRDTTGEQLASGFSIQDTLAWMNYFGRPGENPEDLHRKHPQAYEKAQVALGELEKRGVVEFGRDSNDNVVRYFIRDQKKLDEIAAKSAKR